MDLYPRWRVGASWLGRLLLAMAVARGAGGAGTPGEKKKKKKKKKQSKKGTHTFFSPLFPPRNKL